jgi:large subunit ribosomal protein L4
MPLVKVYSTGKKKLSEIELDEQIFNTEIKDYLLHDAIRMQLAKRRAGTASTRNRVIFGPTPRDFGFAIPKKVKKQALRIALSVRAGEGKLLVLNQFQLKEIKTKSFLEVLDRFGMEKALIVIGQENFNLERSARNVPGVKVLRVEGLNVYDILNHENLILVKDAVEKIQERLAS